MPVLDLGYGFVYVQDIHMDMAVLSEVDGFDWDEGNTNKNWEKHRVAPSECEESL